MIVEIACSETSNNADGQIKLSTADIARAVLNLFSYWADFEFAIINAMENTFPEAQSRGCWYHFGQVRLLFNIHSIHNFKKCLIGQNILLFRPYIGKFVWKA